MLQGSIWWRRLFTAGQCVSLWSPLWKHKADWTHWPRRPNRHKCFQQDFFKEPSMSVAATLSASFHTSMTPHISSDMRAWRAEDSCSTPPLLTESHSTHFSSGPLAVWKRLGINRATRWEEGERRSDGQLFFFFKSTEEAWNNYY